MMNKQEHGRIRLSETRELLKRELKQARGKQPKARPRKR